MQYCINSNITSVTFFSVVTYNHDIIVLEFSVHCHSAMQLFIKCYQQVSYVTYKKTIPVPAAMHPSLLYSHIPAFIQGKNRQWHTMYDAANMHVNMKPVCGCFSSYTQYQLATPTYNVILPLPANYLMSVLQPDDQTSVAQNSSEHLNFSTHTGQHMSLSLHQFKLSTIAKFRSFRLSMAEQEVITATSINPISTCRRPIIEWDSQG